MTVDRPPSAWRPAYSFPRPRRQNVVIVGRLLRPQGQEAFGPSPFIFQTPGP